MQSKKELSVVDYRFSLSGAMVYSLKEFRRARAIRECRKRNKKPKEREEKETIKQ